MFRQSLNRLFGSAASTVRPVASRQVREWYHSQRRRFASSSSSAHRGSEAGADWNVPLMVAMGAFAGAVTYVYQATAPESFEAPSSAAPHTPSLAPSSSPSAPSPASSTPSLPRTSSEDPAKAASVPKKAQILEAGELHATYVLVGGGTACFSAMRGIMDKDRKARILVIAGEDALPYARPPLSKEMWFSPKKTVDAKQFIDWNGQQRDLVYKPSEFYCTPEELMARPHDEGGVAVLTGTTAVRLELRRQRLTLSDGRRVTYDKCLLATGAQPVEVPLFIDSPQPIADHVTLFRRHDDFVRLDGLARSSIRDVAVVGGSFLGSELSVALAQRAQDPTCSLETVTQIFPEQGNLARVFPRYLSEWTTQRVRDQGVRVVPHARVHSVAQTDGGRLLLGLSNGDSIVVDEVVMAVGVTPNVELARRAGLEIDRDNGGIIANAELETRSNVYVAGDCASFHDITLGRRRVEHHDHAVISGRLAGENMAGGVRPYAHQSMFWSDLGPKVGFEAVGLVDSSLETVGVWAHDGDELVSESASELAQDSREYNKGVVFYMRDRHVVGVLLWNMFGKTGIARRLVRLGHPFSDVNDLVHIFNVHESEKAENDDESSQEK